MIHVIRTNKIPFLQSRPSWFLALTSIAIMTLGVLLPFTRLGDYLGFTALPPRYWGYLASTLFCYVLLTQATKGLAPPATLDLSARSEPRAQFLR